MPARWTKRRVIIASVVALIVILQVVGQRVFRSVLHRHALPAAQQALGVPVQLDRASLSLLGGGVALGGLRVSNPEGFTEPYVGTVPSIRLNVGLLSLLANVICVETLAVEDLNVTIARNTNNLVNVLWFQEQLTNQPPSLDDLEDKPVTIPRAKIKRATLSTQIVYRDHMIGTNAEPFQLTWQLKAKAKNLRTYGQEDNTGTVHIVGHLRDNPDAFVTDIAVDIAPVSDPEQPTFHIQGNIQNINLSDFKDLTEALSVTCSNATVKLDITCRQGRFRRGQSKVTVHLQHPKLTGKLAKKYGTIPLPPELPVTMMWRGSLDGLLEDWLPAIAKTIIDTGAANTDSIMDKVGTMFNNLFGPKKNEKDE